MKTILPEFIKQAKKNSPSSIRKRLEYDSTPDLKLLSDSENPEIQALCRVMGLNAKQPK